MKNYDHIKIEKKWQKEWEAKQVYKTLDPVKAAAEKKKPYYVLDMFPYPSGAGLHVGHPRGYIASDVFARMKRMQGFNVLHPMGFDSFGLPAEQYAIQTGKNPGPFTNQLVKRYQKQLSILGFSYDWSRQVETHDPEYYRWTQWIFLQIYNSWYDKSKDKARPIEDLIRMFEKNGSAGVNAVCDGDASGFSKADWKNFSDIEKQNILMKYRLAYEGFASVNWCPELGTVLANDEIAEKNGKLVSERGEFAVEKRSMRQWFMRITAYADRLVAGLDTIDWPNNIKEIQKNWIGKSEGSEIGFVLVAGKESADKNLVIGPAKVEDALAMSEIVAHGWLENNISDKTGFTKEFLEKERGLVFPPPEKNVQKLAQKIADHHGHIVARIGGRIVGMLGSAENSLGQVHFGVYVHPDFTGRGIGTALMNYIFEKYPGKEFEIEVSQLNTRAIALYKRLSFEKVGETNYYQKGVADKYLPCYRMIKKAHQMKVFTTRADTLFGVTYVVLAPEHALVRELKPSITNWSDVEKYLQHVKSISEEDRTDAKREKTGVELRGVFAVNPANGESVPVWVADYVLANYGTGAVMAVPAHDERDFAFARKYGLPVRHVVSRPAQEVPQKEVVRRDGVVSIVRNKKGEILVLQKEVSEEYLFPQGGIEEGENPRDAAAREIREESGYSDVRFVAELGAHENYFEMKEATRHRITHTYLFELVSPANEGLDLDEDEVSFVSHWMMPEDALKVINTRNHKVFLEAYLDQEKQCFAGEGLLVGSFGFDGMSSEEARRAITEKVGGKLVTKYKMRDAIFARQRYWGEPIPLSHTKDGIITPVADKNLPLKLPAVKSYAPTGTGESPLAGVASWVKAGYETNTMPGWAGSSWYFLRYADPKNKKALAGDKSLDYWFGKKAGKDGRAGGVDMYVGGAEHATGHLLYSRFWHKALKDLGHVKTEEPFQALRNQGMIAGPDGRKMSKRWGNVINPDDVVRDLGADTMRVYESFMGPFESHLPWSTDGIVGSRRFVERVWKLQEKVVVKASAAKAASKNEALEKVLHKTIKKVTDDIHAFAFNTAISSMMILVNEMDKAPAIAADDFKKFIQILAPFAPHLCDEIWAGLGEKKTIHLSAWPKWDPKKIVDDTVTLGVQVNGKVRTEITLGLDATAEEVEHSVMAMEEVQKWVDGKPVKKIIYIPGKIISIVV